VAVSQPCMSVSQPKQAIHPSTDPSTPQPHNRRCPARPSPTGGWASTTAPTRPR
jgi:hypothetical protein